MPSRGGAGQRRLSKMETTYDREVAADVRIVAAAEAAAAQESGTESSSASSSSEGRQSEDESGGGEDDGGDGRGTSTTCGWEENRRPHRDAEAPTPVAVPPGAGPVRSKPLPKRKCSSRSCESARKVTTNDTHFFQKETASRVGFCKLYETRRSTPRVDGLATAAHPMARSISRRPCPTHNFLQSTRNFTTSGW